MKCSSIGASKSAPAAGSGRGWRQLPCRAVGSAPSLPELQERGLIKKEKKIWRNKKSPAHTLLSRKEIKCLGGGGGVEEREGGSSTAGRWQGRCEKGRSGASWWQSHCLSWWERPWGQGMGSCLAWGPRDRGCSAGAQQCRGSGLQGQGWCWAVGPTSPCAGSQLGDKDTVYTHGPAGDVPVPRSDWDIHAASSKPGREGDPQLSPGLG